MGPNDQQISAVLVNIHKQLALIANSLDVLAKIARHEHPELFKESRQREAVRDVQK